MTKKDFIALADALRRTRPNKNDACAAHWQWAEDRDALASLCAASNPRFNRQRWLSYIAGECGPNGGVVKKAA